MKTAAEKIKDLREKKAELFKGGGEARIAKQRAKGRLTARERIAELVDDPETFQEMFIFTKHRSTAFGMENKLIPAEGVVTGVGTIDGRPVCIASQDFTVSGGTVGEMHADKICQMQEYAVKTGLPLVVINDSGGARIQESVGALSGYARIFFRNVLASGVVPQISIIAGPCAGGAAYSPALTDFIIMVKGAELFITGPQVIYQVTGEKISAEALGGADVQMASSGNVHFLAENDDHAHQICQKLLSFLPSNNLEDPPTYGTGELIYSRDPGLNSIIPDSANKPYDVKDIMRRIFDNGDFWK